MQPHHHHSMHTPIGGGLPAAQHSLAPHPGMGRPDMQRAHTFPTPPTSASSVMGSMGGADANFQWSGQNMTGSQGSNPLAIDTGLSNARSMPTTPATTPPGANLQNIQQPYPQGSQNYDPSRQMYSAPPVQQGLYQQSAPGQQGLGRYGQNSYVKNEMGPPTVRASGPTTDEHDSKGSNGLLHHGQGNDHVSHGQGEEEAEHEHDGEYGHDNNASYDASRGQYNYASAPPVGTMTSEHPHISPEMTGSPGHQTGSGRATPRTANAPQPYYNQPQGGYNTPPRSSAPSSNLYNVMSSERGTANGNNDMYSSQSEIGNYGTQPIMNGSGAGNKRGRDDDDDGSRPGSRGPGIGEIDGLKRRKTINEGSMGATAYDNSMNRPRAAISQQRRR
jgi:protein SOK2